MTAAEVARALAAHPRWVWAPAMLPVGCYRVGGDGFEPGVDGPPDAVPDLTDAATAGVLLGMLAEALPPGSEVYAGRDAGSLLWAAGNGYRLHETCATLGGAAGRALLAVWGPS